MPQSQYLRNIFVYDGNVPQGTAPKLVAGFMQFGRTTGSEFYFCLEFCFEEPRPSSFQLMTADGTVLPRDATIVTIGNYYVVTTSHLLFLINTKY